MATKTNKAKPNKVCRYCLNELYSHQFVFDETDTFEKIVNETFNLQICQSKTMDRIICIQCVENLHLCAKVKQQILDVQKILMEQYEIFTDIGCESPKQESDSDVFDDYKYDDDIDDSLGDDVKSYMDYIVDEEDGENNCTKEIDIKLPLDEMNETYTTKKRNTLEKGTSKYPRTRKSYLATDAVKHIKRRIKSRKPDKDTPKSATCKTTKQTRNAYDSLRTIRNNTLKLLTNSNMCPFISKRTKFACYSCSESYLDIRQLREHSHSHTIEYDLKTDINRCRGMSYKNVDISNLTCRICSDPCTDINSLREHLINKHDITFESAEHFLLPFKLEEGFKCVICDERYFTFNRLSIHMNTHSNRNVCETCGVSYMNRISLRNHINSIHKEKRCSKCPAVFPTSSAKAKHMRTAHNKARSKRYCMRCEMTFTYAHQLKEHMIEKHGEQRLIVECEHCGKKFSAVANLRVHVRSVHIGERNYPCSLCDLRFFTSCDKVRHEKTHGDGKAFSCEFCEVKFRSKDSQRRHLKRQHGKSKSI